MSRVLRSPTEGSGTAASLSMEQKSRVAEHILEKGAKRLEGKLGSATTVQELFTVFNEVVSQAENSFRLWSKKGVDRMPTADIEAALCERVRPVLEEALGNAVALRIGYAYKRLERQLFWTGGMLTAKQRREFITELANGHGDLEKLLREPKWDIKVDSRKAIMDNLRKNPIDVEMINFSSRAKIVHDVVRMPKSFFDEGIVGHAFTGPAKAFGRTFLKPTAKDVIIKAYGIGELLRDPVKYSQAMERIGLKFDKYPGMDKVLKKAHGAPFALLAGGYIAYRSLTSEEETAPAQLPAEVQEKTAQNEQVHQVFFGSGNSYLRRQAVPLSNQINSMGLPQVEKVKLANILNGYMASKEISQDAKNAFAGEGTNKKAVIDVLAVLQKLDLPGREAEIGKLAIDIAIGIDPKQRVAFAQEVANSKEAKKGDLWSLYEHPPSKYNVTQDWLERPFDAFTAPRKTDTGKPSIFALDDPNMKRLCAAIRQWNRSAKEGGMKLGEDNMYVLAQAMAEVYSDLFKYRGGQRPEVPAEYQEHLQFMKGLMEKGFTIPKAGTALFALEYAYLEKYRGMSGMEEIIYDPLQDEAGQGQVKQIIGSITPEMTSADIYHTVKFEAERQPGMATGEFLRLVDQNIVAIIGRNGAADFERQLLSREKVSAEVRTVAPSLLREAVRIWRANRPKFSEAEAADFVPYVINAALSDPLEKQFDQKQKAEILFNLFNETSSGESVPIQARVAQSERVYISATSLPLSIDLNAPKSKTGAMSERDARTMVTVRALALRHLEALVEMNPETTVEEAKAETVMFVEFLRVNHVGKKNYAPVDKIEAAFEKHKAKQLKQ